MRWPKWVKKHDIFFEALYKKGVLSLVAICAALMAMSIFLILLQYVNVANFKYRDIWKLLGLIVVTGTILVYFVDPPQEWDLARHFEEIGRIAQYRQWDIKYTSGYQDLPVTMALFTLVSYLPSVHFLPAIAIAIIGFIILFILKDYSKQFEADGKQWILVAFFCSIAYMNIVMSISGIRNTLAAAIGALGVYLGIQRKKRIFALILGLMAAGIHPQGVILPILYLINWLLLKLRIKARWMALMVFTAITWLAGLLENVDIPYVKYILSLVDIYSKNEIVVDVRIVAVQIVAAVFFLLTIKKSEKNEDFKDVPGAEYFQMLRLYLFAVLGSLGNNLLFYRMLYPVGILMIPQFRCMLVNAQSSGKPRNVLALLTVLWGGLLLYTLLELYGALSL